MQTRDTQTSWPPVSIGEAAKRLGVAIETVRRWEANGLIRSVRTPGGQRRFDHDEIERVRNGEPPAEADTERAES